MPVKMSPLLFLHFGNVAARDPSFRQFANFCFYLPATVNLFLWPLVLATAKSLSKVLTRRANGFKTAAL